ncbi:hypothetical protein N9W79_00470, partial [bacterium]|nr:hypothetical protein [bacterium]
TSIILSFSTPVFNSSSKAKIFDTAKKLEIDRLTYTDFKADRLTDLENECTTFQRSKTRSSRLGQIHTMQKDRAKLDLKRFEVGRLDAFSAIQSSISKTSAWLQMESAKLDIQISAWKLLYLAGDLESQLLKKQSN